MTITSTRTNLKLPVNLMSEEYRYNQIEYFRYLREQEPLHKGKIGVIPIYLVSRYQDCVDILKSPDIFRNRSNATGKGGRMPFPLPKSMALMMESMIVADGPEHRRLRGLVHQAFVPRRLAYLNDQIETLTHELLDQAEAKGEIDLIKEYALPIPVTVIAKMVGVELDEMPEFASYMTALSEGLTGFRVAKTIMFDIPKAVKFCRGLIERKRKRPGDDILSGLIQAEEDGERLSEDELISMLFLLIIAGYETTVHLISNAVYTLLMHPDQLDRLRTNPDLMESAVEEINRFNGPIRGTKMGFASKDIEMYGVVLPKGKMVMPMLGAANFDPDVFENPEVFDIGRTKNKHLGFGQGIHYCLGAPLARMETQIALRNLLERNPNLKLAIPANQIELQALPGWHRYKNMPVKMG